MGVLTRMVTFLWRRTPPPLPAPPACVLSPMEAAMVTEAYQSAYALLQQELTECVSCSGVLELQDERIVLCPGCYQVLLRSIITHAHRC